MNRTYKGFFGGLTNNTRITPYTSFLFLGTSSKSDTKKGVNRGNERIITTTHPALLSSLNYIFLGTMDNLDYLQLTFLKYR